MKFQSSLKGWASMRVDRGGNHSQGSPLADGIKKEVLAGFLNTQCELQAAIVYAVPCSFSSYKLQPLLS